MRLGFQLIAPFNLLPPLRWMAQLPAEPTGVGRSLDCLKIASDAQPSPIESVLALEVRLFLLHDDHAAAHRPFGVSTRLSTRLSDLPALDSWRRASDTRDKRAALIPVCSCTGMGRELSDAMPG
jgi:hypothetical protein